LGDHIKKNELTGHVARIGKRRGAYRILVGNLREINHLENLGIDGEIILEQIIKKWDEA